MKNKIKIDFAFNFHLDSDEICNFYKKNWSNDIILGNKNYYKWNFIENPFNSKKDFNCLAVSQSNKILGIMGLSKRDFFLDKKKINGAELTTWVIDKNFRGKGLGKKMLIFLKINFDVLIGSGITDEAKKVYLLNGFSFVKNIPRFFKIYKKKNMDNFIKIKNYANNFLDHQKIKEIESIRSLKFENVSNVNSIITDSALKKTSNLFSKSKKWLIWRYLKHPYFKYFIYCIRTNNNKAFFVMRFDEVSKMKIGYVVDIFGNYKIIKLIPRIVDQLAKEKKINVIEFYSTSGMINSIFIKNNWVSVIDHDHIKFMNRLYPPKWVEPATTSLILWSKHKNESFYNFSKLYINKSDLDLDRPSIGFLKSNYNEKYKV